MERVLIVGAKGAGKSGFAQALGKLTGLPVATGPKGARWILDGPEEGELRGLLELADQVFFFDFSPGRCACRALKRANPKRARLCLEAWTDAWRRCGRLRKEIKNARCQAVVFTKPRQARDFIWILRQTQPASSNPRTAAKSALGSEEV